ncbi:MAG: hypothetical protein ACRD5J_01345 [Nitrososphaeraceae archaeon]
MPLQIDSFGVDCLELGTALGFGHSPVCYMGISVPNNVIYSSKWMNRPGDPTPTRQSVLPYVVFDMKNNTYIAAGVEA